MMPRILDTTPTPIEYEQTQRLDGQRYRVALRWLPRLAGWYADVDAPDGTPLARGRRVAPGQASLLADRSLQTPPGVMLAIGDDIPVQSALGDRLFIAYVTEAELGALG